ncbi:MAG: PKD domain-containing protein [Saprospiraceae bacterium]
MKKTTLLTLLFTCLFVLVAQAQGGFIQLGDMQVVDQGNRMIATSDGGYITVGSAGSKAVMYKTDCLGQLVAEIEKAYIPGPATFSDVTELADGSIVAVGTAGLATLTDTGGHVILLKTTPSLVETASSSFFILGKEAQGKSIAKTATGHLLVWGEVTGVSIDFTDAFFQRVSPTTLQPTAEPVIFNKGVDLASRILPTKDGNYLLSGSSFTGNIFNPDAPINNTLRAYKVDENGALLWEANLSQIFAAKYGVARICGAAQNPDSDNFMVAGTFYGGNDNFKQDPFFALISNGGMVLDTAFASGPGQQRMFSIAAHHDLVGLFSMAGDGDGSPLGVPSIAFAQAFEQGNTILAAALSLDPGTPISLRELVEIDAGRFAYMGTIPDNPNVLSATDILVATPAATVGVVYQNCALAATLTGSAVAFQWFYEDQPIANANQGVYFPTQPGLYSIGILDDKGCYGLSDTFRVEGPKADFEVSSNGLTVSLTNTSEGAVSYLWDFCDGNLSTLPNPTHTYATPGVYCVKLIATNSCGLKDTVLQQIGVTPSEEPSWLSHFSLSPNPTSGIFSLEMSGESQENVAFNLFNSMGQLAIQEVMSFKNGFLQKTFDLGPLPAGMYSLHIQSGKETKSLRVIKL